MEKRKRHYKPKPTENQGQCCQLSERVYKNISNDKG